MPRRTWSGSNDEEVYADIAAQLRREAVSEHTLPPMKLCSQAYGVLKKAINEKGVSGGICRSMTVEWLKGQHGGVPLLGRLFGIGGEVKSSVLEKLCGPYLIDPNASPSKQRQYIENNLARFPYRKISYEQTSSGTKDLDKWCISTPSDGYGLLRILTLRMSRDKQNEEFHHAIALDLRDASCFVLFDPNIGEFRFRPANLERFLRNSLLVQEGGSAYYANKTEFRTLERYCCCT